MDELRRYQKWCWEYQHRLARVDRALRRQPNLIDWDTAFCYYTGGKTPQEAVRLAIDYGTARVAQARAPRHCIGLEQRKVK